MADPKCKDGCKPGCAHWPVSERVGDPVRMAKLVRASRRDGSTWTGSSDRDDSAAGNDRYTNR